MTTTQHAGGNRHMAAFERHAGCDPKAMTYPEGKTGTARCGDCGATWPLDVEHGGYKFLEPVNVSALVD